MKKFKKIKKGTITSPAGFSADGIYAGLKSSGEDKLDLGILVSSEPCEWAATYTDNKIKSSSIDYCKEVKGKIKGIIVNSGSANCCVGDQGLIDSRDISLKCKEIFNSSVPFLMSSTGVIGVEIPVGLIMNSIEKFNIYSEGGEKFSRAIITTDSKTKNIAIEVNSKKGNYKIGGVAKGSGMVHPKMGTMLSFITTDVDINSDNLTTMLRKSVTNSFNQIDIDGDTSTNDTVVIMSNGMSRISLDSKEELNDFQEALDYLTKYLAKQIAEDGEGISHLITVEVNGAKNDKDALSVSNEVVSSSLVKTAIFGKDPNWGRIMMAIGNADAEIERDKIKIFVNGIQISESGKSISFHYQSVLSALDNFQIDIVIDLCIGKGRGMAWGSDLTEEYVVFNSAYTT
ncbi:MAG: bifunctional glutamate N-acetyltransferase/amino-acid acetyltransferase ArgJ [Dehalococcoidia bacterium]|nr:bifunctional glutamate N-acetyltransferase/amino-acid acetyltransferase ArgJ [Chloroflexota bacterium]|tara:strand:+ start:8582 stop:9781 length:1200 start_codon:yes stop_codon:yes gene_type:complete